MDLQSLLYQSAMPKQNRQDIRRHELREALWPGSSSWIWDSESSIGYTVVPRVLPLVLHLIKILADGGKTGDPSPAYIDLWCRDFGQGMITIMDEERAAYSSGYSSSRAHRTWKEHMKKLVNLGFIKVKKDGIREFGQVLLLNPLSVCESLNKAGKVPEEWWTAFMMRITEIKASLPGPLQTSEPTKKQVEEEIAF
jgi:hypothetical protein